VIRLGLATPAQSDDNWCSHCLVVGFFFSSRRRHTSSLRDWSSDVCSSDLNLKRREDPSLEDCERLMPPQEYEARLRRALPEWQQIGRASCRERGEVSADVVSAEEYEHYVITGDRRFGASPAVTAGRTAECT